MSTDVDFIFPCNHVNGQFFISNCPVCLGLGYYWDVVIGQDGQFIEIEGVNKVVQEIVHILSHEEGIFSDYGYPEYGSRLIRFVGSKNTDELRLKFQIIRDLNYWNQIKEAQHNRYDNVTRNELIRRIVSIDTTNTADEQNVEISAVLGDSEQLEYFNIRKFKVS